MATPRKSASAKSTPARVQREAAGLLAGYSKTPRPLGGYAALVALFTVGLASALTAANESKGELPKLSWSDLLLFGIATHKLSRIATKDLVTSPFRAPFVKFKKSAGAAAKGCRKPLAISSPARTASHCGLHRPWSLPRNVPRARPACSTESSRSPPPQIF